jgi:Mg/Co/Ni transporter MgtE
MEPEDKKEVQELLDFRDDTAGGLMDPGYLHFPLDATVADAMEELRKNEEILEDIHDLFLVDEEERLCYAIPLAKLIIAPGDTNLKDLAADPVLYVHLDERQDRVAEMFDKYNLLSLPVVDEQRRLVGVITVDDVLSLLRQG